MELSEVLKGSLEFQYMLLSRLQMDCNFYLGYGNRRTSQLWGSTVEEHIKYMKELWNNFEEKPEWLSLEEIERYESEMKAGGK
jgi:hypothetical protein